MEVPLPPRGGARLRDLLGGADRAVGRCRPSASALLRPLTRWLAERGTGGQRAGVRAGDRRAAPGRRGALTALAPYDAVLTPTLAVPPLPVGAIRDDDDPAADFEAQKAFTPWTSAWNVTGSRPISLPLHWTPDGLPVGVMLAARPGRGGAAALPGRPGRGGRAVAATGTRPAGERALTLAPHAGRGPNHPRRRLTSLHTRPTRSSQPCWMRSSGIVLGAGLLDEDHHLQRREQCGGQEARGRRGRRAG